MTSLLSVSIHSPEKVVWEGKAQSVSSVNSQGPFDILPFHANFISIIENKPIKIKTPEKTLEFTFPNAVIYTRTNIVSIYSNI